MYVVTKQNYFITKRYTYSNFNINVETKAFHNDTSDINYVLNNRITYILFISS